ncbi:hypothetical protein QMP26_05645 [Enterocloster clostridioformis]
MKKIESYPPLKAVELANKKMPEIWDAIEKTKVSMRNRNSPPWREDIYIPAWQIYESTFLNGPYHIPKEARPRALAVVLSILASWRQYKEVYRFAPEMENLLYQQADFNLPLDTLLNLPFSCFYIEAPQICGERYHGFFIASDQAKDGSPLLRCMSTKKDDPLTFDFSEIRLEKGKTLKYGIAKAATSAAAEVGLKSLHGQLASELLISAQYQLVVLSRLSQLLLYLTAQNADLKESGKSYGRAAGKNIKDRYREIRNWDVGFRVVNKLEKASSHSGSNSNQGSNGYHSDGKRRRSPKPHWRCSHWHLFWTGKRKSENRKFIIKWIPPTLINCKSSEELPVIVNQIR